LVGGFGRAGGGVRGCAETSRDVVFAEARLNDSATKVETVRHYGCTEDSASLIETVVSEG
jgi:hypothetical protein